MGELDPGFEPAGEMNNFSVASGPMLAAARPRPADSHNCTEKDDENVPGEREASDLQNAR